MIYIYNIYLSLLQKKKVTTILPPGIGPLPTQQPQVRWRKRQDVPENLRNGHWQVAPPLSRGMWDKPFAKRYPFKGTVIWWSTKFFFHDFCYCTKIWFLQKVQAWWEFDGQKSKEPIVIVKFTISSGNVFIIWLLQAGLAILSASLYLQVRNETTLSSFIRPKEL